MATDYNKALESYPALCRVIREALETRKPTKRAEISIMHANVPIVLGCSTICFKDREDKDLGVIVVFHDMSFAGGEKKSI